MSLQENSSTKWHVRGPSAVETFPECCVFIQTIIKSDLFDNLDYISHVTVWNMCIYISSSFS